MATEIPITTYTTVPFTFEEAVEEFNKTTKTEIQFDKEFLRDVIQIVGNDVHGMYHKIIKNKQPLLKCTQIQTDTLENDSVLLNYVVYYDAKEEKEEKKLGFRMGAVTEENLREYLDYKKNTPSTVTLEYFIGAKHLQLCTKQKILFSGVLVKQQTASGISITLNPMSGSWNSIKNYLLGIKEKPKDRTPLPPNKKGGALDCLNLLMTRYMLKNVVAKVKNTPIIFQDECLEEYYNIYKVPTNNVIRHICKSEIPELLSISSSSRYGDFIQTAKEQLDKFGLSNIKIKDVIPSYISKHEKPPEHKEDEDEDEDLTFGQLITKENGIKRLEILLKGVDINELLLKKQASSSQGGNQKEKRYVMYKNRKYRLREGPRQGTFILVGKEKKKVYLH